VQVEVDVEVRPVEVVAVRVGGRDERQSGDESPQSKSGLASSPKSAASGDAAYNGSAKAGALPPAGR
jgi:hypothetical protein